MRVLIVRPAPGSKSTADAVAAMGLDPVVVPLFEVVPCAWDAPDPDAFDAVVMTSANAARHGGPALAAYANLACLAVGEATAAAARDAGFRHVTAGTGDASELAGSLRVPAAAPDGAAPRVLHLAGLDHQALAIPGTVTIPVYAAVAIDAAVPTADVALVHSPRAGARLAELVADRAATRIIAISATAARACGGGWAALDIAETPREHAMLACLARVCEAATTKQMGHR